MRFKRRKPSGARIEMIPLIDIIFLLLVVFIYAMLSMTVHKGIRIELPAATTADRDDDRDPFTVTIGPRGTVYVDLSPLDLDELSELVAAEAGRRKDVHIQVNAHEDISHGRLVQVLDSIRAGGVTSLSIMTEDYEAQH
jgi:biopolymer transport protein ExbD